MTLIQNVSEALHQVESELFRQDLDNPFALDPRVRLNDMLNVVNKSKTPIETNRPVLIQTAAILVRLIAELPETDKTVQP